VRDIAKSARPTSASGPAVMSKIAIYAAARTDPRQSFE
jgi:hypothetical protein